MKVQVLGPGCSRCKALESRVRDALAELGIEAELEKVTDIQAIASMGVMMTPGLVVDGVVKSAGRVLSRDEILRSLKGEA